MSKFSHNGILSSCYGKQKLTTDEELNRTKIIILVLKYLLIIRQLKVLQMINYIFLKVSNKKLFEKFLKYREYLKKKTVVMEINHINPRSILIRMKKGNNES